MSARDTFTMVKFVHISPFLSVVTRNAIAYRIPPVKLSSVLHHKIILQALRVAYRYQTNTYIKEAK
jgi:hypothetical protein